MTDDPTLEDAQQAHIAAERDAEEMREQIHHGTLASPPPAAHGPTTALTEEERDRFNYLASAMSGQVPGIQIALMRVRNAGMNRAMVVLVEQMAEGARVTPMALLADDAMLEDTVDPEDGTKPTVQPRPDDPVEVTRDLLTQVADEIPGEMPSVETVSGWTDAERESVDGWALAHRFAADGHAGVQVPEIPAVLR